MPKSLLEQLPEIVAKGKQEAEKILESLEGRHRITLQTREWVMPAKDSTAADWINDNVRRDNFAAFAAPQAEFFGAVQSSLDSAVSNWQNRLIYGDNLLAMAALLAGDEQTPSLRGKIDLIYIDPPFDSKADYRTKVILPTPSHSGESRNPAIEIEQKPTVIEQFAYSDTWSDGTASYLAMITPRLILMRELLSDSGSIYVHLDWHVGHYVKIVLDEVFGKDNFLNTIARQKTLSRKFQSGAFGNIHDTIFIYSKSGNFYFQKQIDERDEDAKLSRFPEYDNEKKLRYVWDNFTQAGQGEPRQFGDVVIAPPTGKHWIWSQERINDGWKQGIVKIRGKMPRLKRYETEGIAAGDIWVGKQWVIHAQSGEAVDYDTQKPESVLERIVQASCPENGLIADFNGGSGTTAAVAERMNRRWITTDLGKPACMIMRKRLINQNSRPFLYQAIGDYQVEAAKSTLGRQFKIGDLSQIVLQLFGALPLPPEENPGRNLGRLDKTLVLADTPNKLTGLTTLNKAIAQRDSLMGGWDKVIVLGWNFAPSIGHDIAALNDDRLEVLVIPPDLLDRLKKKGGLEKLKGSVRFSSLQYLTIKPVQRVSTGAEETLTVMLDNYVLLSPEAINLDEGNRAKLQAVMNAEPLAMIEYWAVDPDYDGQVFRSVWQDYRGNTENDADALRVVTKAVLQLPHKLGVRKVCVRVVDVFGFEAEALCEVEV